MKTYNYNIPGYIKYLGIIDRDVIVDNLQNIPIILINLGEERKEVDYQMMVFSSLDFLEVRDFQKDSKILTDDYIGLLMPFYDIEYDLASYGYVGNNGFKFVAIKIEDHNSVQETSSEIKLKEVFPLINQMFDQIHSKLINLLLNPFYDKKEFYSMENSNFKDNYVKSLIEIIKKNQII